MSKKTLREAASARFEEKKSVFIGYAAPVKSEEEALAIVKAKKEEFSDATHNVWAYYIDGGARARFSDDNEPQGTAGMPVLNVLKMSGATDMVCVVTRYFGGTLLGAGGLVRAYGEAAKEAVNAAGIATFTDYSVMEVNVSYSDHGKITTLLQSCTDKTDYADEVKVTVAVPLSEKEEIISKITSATAARAVINEIAVEERPI